MASKAVMILNRMHKCNCGCGGSDPWHKRYYRRVVTQITDVEGTVQMPYSTQPVRVTRRIVDASRGVYCSWTVDRDSVVFDKA